MLTILKEASDLWLNDGSLSDESSKLRVPDFRSNRIMDSGVKKFVGLRSGTGDLWVRT
jgi:hypothetical protein